MAKLFFPTNSMRNKLADVFTDITGGTMARSEIFSVIDELDEVFTGIMMLPPKKRKEAIRKKLAEYRSKLTELKS